MAITWNSPPWIGSATTGESMAMISLRPSAPAAWWEPKFVWPDPGPKFKPVMLTQSKEEHWKKWIDIYNQKMLSKGTFRNLYVYGYDTPEAYAIEKDGKMYYAFFAPSASPWKGEIELRGLQPGSYHVTTTPKAKTWGR